MMEHAPKCIPAVAVLLIARLSLSVSLTASDSQNPPGANPPRQDNPIFKALIPIEDVDGLPRVLLIGDSISKGYTLPMSELISPCTAVSSCAGPSHVFRTEL